jgi:hypothetical protein
LPFRRTAAVNPDLFAGLPHRFVSLKLKSL